MLRADSIASSLRRGAALTLGLAAITAAAPALAQDAQVENGFALQANLGARANVLGLVNANTNNPNLPGAGFSLDTQLFGGYKLGRLLIGLGIELQNATVNTRTTVAGNTVSTSNATTAFLIGPEVQFALLRTADNRVELIGDLALHFGHLFTPAQDNNNNAGSNFMLSYQVGPGVRFWAHKHFAINALTGFAGELYHVIPPSGSNATADISTHGVFGSFGMLGVF